MRKEADDIGPTAELEHWKERMAKFNVYVPLKIVYCLSFFFRKASSVVTYYCLLCKPAKMSVLPPGNGSQISGKLSEAYILPQLLLIWQSDGLICHCQ